MADQIEAPRAGTRGADGHHLLGRAHRHRRGAGERRVSRMHPCLRMGDHRKPHRGAGGGGHGTARRAPRNRSRDRGSCRGAGHSVRRGLGRLAPLRRLHGSGGRGRRCDRRAAHADSQRLLAPDHRLGRIDRPRRTHGADGGADRLQGRASRQGADAQTQIAGGLRSGRRHRLGLQCPDRGGAVRRRDRDGLVRHGKLRAAPGLGGERRCHHPPPARVRTGVRDAPGPFRRELGAHSLRDVRRAARASGAAVSGLVGVEQAAVRDASRPPVLEVRRWAV